MSREKDEAFIVKKNPERAEAGDYQVKTKVELAPTNKKRVGDVPLENKPSFVCWWRQVFHTCDNLNPQGSFANNRLYDPWLQAAIARVKDICYAPSISAEKKERKLDDQN